MGTTSNYSWPYPESTDPVADGATDIQALADAADTTGRAIQLATIQRFADSTARDTALSGIEVEGMFAFLQDTDVLTYWDGSAWQEFSTGPDVFGVEYVVVAAGGGAGVAPSGAGGMLTGTAYLELGAYSVSVGAGGTGASGGTTEGTPGGQSRFGQLIGVGGGEGGTAQRTARRGGSGGAKFNTGTVGPGIVGQGNDGGDGNVAGQNSGGGGGAGAAGQDAPSTTVAGNGGVGLVSTIISDTQATSWSVGEVSGSDVYYAGGGGGFEENGGDTPGTGGLGGGGDGGANANGTNGTANTGGGAGGKFANGGSGVVILKWLTADASISVGAGLTSVNTTVGDYTVYAFTAGTDTVTFS